jgi:hypothetical protein
MRTSVELPDGLGRDVAALAGSVSASRGHHGEVTLDVGETDGVANEVDRRRHLAIINKHSI